MGTVVISGVTYEIYGEHVGAGSATEYAGGSLSPQAAAWLALSPDDEKRTLVMAARVLNRIDWEGEPTDPYPSVQPLAWPRTGVVDGDGNPVDSGTVPQRVVDASYELAMLYALDAAASDASTGGGNFKRLRAGSAEVEYFGPQAQTRFPATVQELVGDFMDGAVSSGAASGFAAFGTEQDSHFEDCDDHDLVRPL